MAMAWYDGCTDEILLYRTSSKVERVKEYLAAETLPDLTPEEIKAIEEEGSKLHHRVFVSVVTWYTPAAD